MRYSLHYIFNNRYDPHRSQERKIAERYVILNAIGKLLSPYPTYLFLNLGIKPDWVTFASICFIISGAGFLIAGYLAVAIVALLCFLLLDSVDGDMARCVGPTKYGSILDSFGADFFYALIPSSVGFYLFSHGIETERFAGEIIFFIAIAVSVTFLLYRILNFKTLWFLAGQGKESAMKAFGEREQSNSSFKSFFTRLAKLLRHEAVKGNFFAEPGLLFWFSVLLLAGWREILVFYLILVLVNNVMNVGLNLVRAYITFLKS